MKNNQEEKSERIPLGSYLVGESLKFGGIMTGVYGITHDRLECFVVAPLYYVLGSLCTRISNKIDNEDLVENLEKKLGRRK